MTDNHDLEKLRERALASETDANQLFEIAAQHPEVFAEVAANPNAYPDLLNWLEQVGDERVRAVVLARRGGLMGRAALTQAQFVSSASCTTPNLSAPQMQQLSAENQEESKQEIPQKQSPSPYSPFAPRQEEDFAVPVADAAREEAESPVETAQVTENMSSQEDMKAEDSEQGRKPAESEEEKLTESSIESQLDSEFQAEEGSEAEGDEDATHLGSIPMENLQTEIPSIDEGATRLAATVSLPTQQEAPSYLLPQQQPVITPPANYPPYSPYAAYYGNPPVVNVPQRKKPGHNWGIIILTVLLVLALISFTVVVTWIVSSRSGKAGASAFTSATASTKVVAVIPSVTPTAPTFTQSGKSIPLNVGYEDMIFTRKPKT
ncbi:hypothetical protein [Varibaculum vaginae]|uniref:variant leucine-rich repeat-containing protein n=1 Tax=Varibaculum vaginae TaxID=2364797 RepID=UPI000F098198|nr:hypothetical protein [Varibaculum vaginae]